MARLRDTLQSDAAPPATATNSLRVSVRENRTTHEGQREHRETLVFEPRMCRVGQAQPHGRECADEEAA
eukprot:CAMPEP_0183373816 /NCGR_PEP_ID=MMETSP0164_2-20130417/112582_1 /TAXON_ID=221442 /ORGANISM="Coccolithus pelagicus ssp braarudi, Strain PLY182g" /LENGTH=68 /DNA_ID=CAMNT_0025550751 /DNA_START=237 /DNA_END=443 /DNA_ORIENTATION=-